MLFNRREGKSNHVLRKAGHFVHPALQSSRPGRRSSNFTEAGSFREDREGERIPTRQEPGRGVTCSPS